MISNHNVTRHFRYIYEKCTVQEKIKYLVEQPTLWHSLSKENFGNNVSGTGRNCNTWAGQRIIFHATVTTPAGL